MKRESILTYVNKNTLLKVCLHIKGPTKNPHVPIGLFSQHPCLQKQKLLPPRSYCAVEPNSRWGKLTGGRSPPCRRTHAVDLEALARRPSGSPHPHQVTRPHHAVLRRLKVRQDLYRGVNKMLCKKIESFVLIIIGLGIQTF